MTGRDNCVRVIQEALQQARSYVNLSLQQEIEANRAHADSSAFKAVDAALVRSFRMFADNLVDAVSATIGELENQQAVPDAFFDVIKQLTSRPKRRAAAFTIVRNEPFFLELWCNYYGTAVGDDNLFILDNSTDDDSIRQAKLRFPTINVVPVPSSVQLDWKWITHVVKLFQKLCFLSYDVVVFSDSDEYLIPTESTLRDYVEEFSASGGSYVRAQGWGVVQRPGAEAPATKFDVLADRQVAWRAPNYDKTLISRVPLEWAKGHHTIYRDGEKRTSDPVDLGLELVHLRDVDIDTFWERCKLYHRLNNKRALGFQGASDPSQVTKYFETRVTPWSNQREYADTHKLVPDRWRQALVFNAGRRVTVSGHGTLL